MAFTDIFIRRPVLSLVLSALLLLVGMRALMLLPVRQFPLLTNTIITIRTTYPGAPPELMQGFITTPIERAVASVEGLDYITSSSTQGNSNIQVYMKLNYDPGRATTDVLTKVQQVKSQLPQEANDPVISRNAASEQVMSILLNSETMSGAEIADHVVRVIQPILSTVEGVSSIDINGAGALAMRLWLNPSRMAAKGVTAEEISAAIRANNVQSAPGQTKSYQVSANVVANTGLRDVEAFRSMVVKTTNGVSIHLSDVADVEFGAESFDQSALSLGKPGVMLWVQPMPDGNPLTISKEVRERIPEIERTLPPGLNMAIGSDNSLFISESIKEVIKTLAAAVVIVIVVIFLFLGSVRSVLIPIVTIPLSMIGVCILMLAMGFSINLLTLLAMVLATGLVVDDAIVMVENIHRHLEEGLSPMQAALVGAREIVGPVISMTITLAAVYAPIGFLSGLTGAIFKEFAFSLAGAMVLSGIIALTLSPMMCSKLLKPVSEEGEFAHKVSRFLDRVTDVYSRALSVTLAYRPAVGIFGLAILASVAFLFMHTKSELAPMEDQGMLRMNIRGPQTVNVDYMFDNLVKIDQIITKFLPEVTARFSFVGRNGGDSSVAGGGMRLLPWSERERNANEMQVILQRELNKLDGVIIFVMQQPALPGASGGPPVQLVVTSAGDYNTIYETVEGIKAAARRSGLFTALDSSLNFNSPVVQLDIDRAKANDLGLTMDSIGRSLATLVGENYVNRFILEGRAYQVIPQVPRTQRLSGNSLTQFYVRTASGRQIPLSTVVSVRETVQPNALTRFNQLNSATMQAGLAPGVTMSDALAFLNQQVANLPEGFTASYLGEARQYVEEGGQLTITFLFALLIIYLVLAAQFESLRDPLVVLVSVPMSICGALLPLFFGVATLNIYTQIGLVTLIGLISKHGILMVAFARDMQLREGCGPQEAIERAARVRLRPILMTTLAMIAGLMPLVVATGAGAASRMCLGVVVVGGMSVGTIFTLFMLPTVYTWLAGDRRRQVPTEELIAGHGAAAPAE